MKLGGETRYLEIIVGDWVSGPSSLGSPSYFILGCDSPCLNNKEGGHTLFWNHDWVSGPSRLGSPSYFILGFWPPLALITKGGVIPCSEIRIEFDGPSRLVIPLISFWGVTPFPPCPRGVTRDGMSIPFQNKIYFFCRKQYLLWGQLICFVPFVNFRRRSFNKVCACSFLFVFYKL